MEKNFCLVKLASVFNADGVEKGEETAAAKPVDMGYSYLAHILPRIKFG